jgi:RNAse (barnase) inhibitor barstar
MRELVLDGANWNTKDDVYDAFFQAVGAPEWHGRNFDALIDSIETGSINTVEVPYRLVIKNYDLVGIGARQMTNDLVDLIREIAGRGCPVEIRVEKGSVCEH